MDKTLETIVRDKLSTGYDPVKLEVSARGINEGNIEVAIEGIKYSITGNRVQEISGNAGSGDTAAEPSTPDGDVETNTAAEEPTAEEGNTNSPQSEPDVAQGDAAAGETTDRDGEVEGDKKTDDVY